MPDPPTLYGRWDLTVGEQGESFPSWLELTPQGGRFVGQVGSARPLAKIEIKGQSLLFQLPPQYEQRKDDLVFQGTLEANTLKGTTTLEKGQVVPWQAIRAPDLPAQQPTWAEPIQLIEQTLANWRPRSPQASNNWSIEKGMLVNVAHGSDLVSKQAFKDFRLIAEYSYPEKSNSGIYLRGRYEFQIVDDYESGNAGTGNSGAIYGFIAPSKNAILPPGEWNHVETTLLGRFVTVTLNGHRIIDAQEIPGITGGALDSDESAPGPIFLQGDHGPVTFRRLTLTPNKQ